jgi:hypothetical protein
MWGYSLVFAGFAWVVYAALVTVAYWNIAIDLFGSAWSDRFFGWATSDGSTLLSGFGGALIGGAVSLVLARQASRETLSRDAATRRAEEQASALTVLLTAAEMLTYATTFLRHFKPALDAPPSEKMWSRVLPMAVPARSHSGFAEHDLVPLVRAKAAPLVTRCYQLETDVSALEESFAQYRELRTVWDEAAAAHTKIGQYGQSTTEFPPGEQSRIADFRSFMMESLVRQTVLATPRTVVDAFNLCNDLNDAFRRYLGADLGFKVDIEAGALPFIELAKKAIESAEQRGASAS